MDQEESTNIDGHKTTGTRALRIADPIHMRAVLLSAMKSSSERGDLDLSFYLRDQIDSFNRANPFMPALNPTEHDDARAALEACLNHGWAELASPLLSLGVASSKSMDPLARPPGIEPIKLDLLYALPEAFPGLLAFWDTSLRCVFSNSQYQRWIDKSPAEMKRISHHDLFPEEVRATTEPKIILALQGLPQKFEISHQGVADSDGNRAPARSLVQYIPHQRDGITLGFFAVVIDITEIEMSRRQLSIYDSAINSISQGVAITDLDRRVIHCNSAYAEITGYESQEMIGHDQSRLLGPLSDQKTLALLKDAINRREPFAATLIEYRKDGETFHNDMLISVQRDNLGRPTHFIDIIRDASDAAANKSAIAELNADLERKVIERTQELSDQRERAISQERYAALGAMGANIAHELNTPLGNSRLATDALEHHLERFKASISRSISRSELDRFIESAHEAATILKSNLARSAEIVSVFKRITIEQADEAPRLFKLFDLVQDAALSLSPTLSKASIQVDLSGLNPDTAIFGIPGPLALAFVNLIQNAAVHAFYPGQGGRIEISTISSTATSTIIAARDDGNGIPDEIISRIFDPFFTTARESGGTGIGLHVARQAIVDAYGGKIEASNDPRGGALFIIELPLGTISA